MIYTRSLLKRLLLSFISLWLLSVIVFAMANVLPGDFCVETSGRNAGPEQIEQCRIKLGLDRPLVVQYGDWISHFVVGDMGTSYAYRAPVAPFIVSALINS